MRLTTWAGRRLVHLRWEPGEDGGGFDVVVLEGALDRLLGLLGTVPGHVRAEPVLLAPCSSVHTVGMRYAIDVALADSWGRVLASHACVAPGRLVGRRGACLVLERPHVDAPWPREGDVLTGWERLPAPGGLAASGDAPGWTVPKLSLRLERSVGWRSRA